MEGFLEKFFPRVYTQMKKDTKISNYCRFNSELLTTFTSSLYIAGLVASLFASPITRAFGRRASMLVGGAMFLAGAALGGAAANVYMVIFGRALLGAGIGFTNQVIRLLCLPSLILYTKTMFGDFRFKIMILCFFFFFFNDLKCRSLVITAIIKYYDLTSECNLKHCNSWLIDRHS